MKEAFNAPATPPDEDIPVSLNHQGRRVWAAIRRKYLRRGWSDEKAGAQALKDTMAQGYRLRYVEGVATPE
jgi:hypothetical protein